MWPFRRNSQPEPVPDFIAELRRYAIVKMCDRYLTSQPSDDRSSDDIFIAVRKSDLKVILQNAEALKQYL